MLLAIVVDNMISESKVVLLAIVVDNMISE